MGISKNSIMLAMASLGFGGPMPIPVHSEQLQSGEQSKYNHCFAKSTFKQNQRKQRKKSASKKRK